MKAKRRGVTSDSSSKGIGSAFGGFGAKMATTKPAAGFSFEANKGLLISHIYESQMSHENL